MGADVCESEVLEVGFSTDTDCPDTMLLTDYGQGTLSTAESHHIKISLDNSQITVEITGGGQPNYIATKARTPTKGSWLRISVPVWFMSNKRSGEFNLGNATLSNIKIISFNKQCDLDVLSVDHKSGVEGKYFNFDKKQLDEILGRTDWSNERLEVSNGKEVVVWRNPNGGSKGDAPGRWDPYGSAKENDWSVGDQVTFADC